MRLRYPLAALLISVISASPALAKHHHHRHHHKSHYAARQGVILAHPSGCPRVSFCGCGAAVRVFGRPIRSLWLAANWYRFPHAQAAPGMAAVRRHHVFVLEAPIGGSVWQVYDANSGHHTTRIHARSIAGFTIVNPKAYRLASS